MWKNSRHLPPLIFKWYLSYVFISRICMDQNTPIIVTGKLIEEPSDSLRKRIKMVSFVYFTNSLWILYLLSSRHASTMQWTHLAVTTFLLAFWLPLCGLHSAKNPGSGRLACFSGIQGCLGCWNFVTLVGVLKFIVMLTTLCRDCAPVFAVGNETCVLDPANDSLVPMGSPVEISVHTCDGHIPSMARLISGLLMLAMTTVSCSAAFHGRKTGKAKLVHVVTVQTLPVIQSPMQLVTPQIPEDL